jgi:hypothetical protein
VNSKSFGNLPPQPRKMPSLKHQDTVPRRKGIDDGRFPGSGSRSWIHHNRAAGLDNFPHVLQGFFHAGGKFGSAMIHHRTIDGAQHTVRYVAGTRYLKKMSACVDGDLRNLRLLKTFMVYPFDNGADSRLM